MTSKLHRDHSAETAMLAYRTGLSAAICKAWIEAPILGTVHLDKTSPRCRGAWTGRRRALRVSGRGAIG
jgi:hypothetical protein